MKTAELTGALLDYWVARAEGVPAVELEIREVPRTDWKICVHKMPSTVRGMAVEQRLGYSTDWLLAGPLLEKHRFDLLRAIGGGWSASPPGEITWFQHGDTPLIAICRAVVRAAFGDEVEDLPCA